MDEREPIEIRQDKTVVTVFWVTYVHGVGAGIRAIVLPTAALSDWLGYLEQEDGEQCEHQTGGIWIFQGLWPNEMGRVFTHVAFDIHEVAQLMAKPGLIRLFGKEEAVTLIPVDPVTGDITASVLDYNNWIEYHMGIAERADFGALQKSITADMIGDIESLLRSVADSNGNGKDNNSE